MPNRDNAIIKVGGFPKRVYINDDTLNLNGSEVAPH